MGRDIRVGERIRASDVIVEIWPVDKIPTNTIVNVKDAVGARPRVVFFAGEPLRADKLTRSVPPVGFVNGLE